MTKARNMRRYGSTRFVDNRGKPFPFIVAYALAKHQGKDLSNWNFPDGYTQSDVELYISGNGFSKVKKSVTKLHNWMSSQKEIQGIFDYESNKDAYSYWGV